MQHISSDEAQMTIIGADGDTYNPLPTTIADVVNSSVTFTCPVAMYALITVSAQLQMNSASAGNTPAANVLLNVDGTDQGRTVYAENVIQSGSNIKGTYSRTFKIPLSAGSHTIKLRCVANIVTNAVAIVPSWWGLLIAQ